MHKSKQVLCALIFLVLYLGIKAQPLPDSVKVFYTAASNNYAKHECLHTYLESIRSDSNFNTIAAELQKYFLNKNDHSSSDYVELTKIGIMSKTGDFANALDKSLEYVKIFQARQDNYGEVLAQYRVSQALFYAGEIKQSNINTLSYLPLALKLQNNLELALCYNAIASICAQMNMPDSGISYAYKGLGYAIKINSEMVSSIYGTLGENYIAKKDFDSAIIVSKKGIPLSTDANNITGLYGNITQSFLGNQDYDSAMHYAGITISLSRKYGFTDQLKLGYESLSKCYEQKRNTDSAFKYYKLAVQTKDELFSSQKANEIKTINLREQSRQQKTLQDKIDFKNKIRIYTLLIGLVMILGIAFILYRNNRQKQKVNTLLQVEKQKVETTLSELNATQSQLIQSEKMASLGELTAGIAHEIQNPLNFVNNFSEVSTELVDEMNEEISKGNLEDAKEIAIDLKQNLIKINHHGNRAGDIVKGMLQHSRSSAGVKEPTNINALADEYLRLAYHGLRAKDKSFNADLKTDFDDSIGTINIIPQDIGRVLLNLYNNAFYAVNDRFRHAQPDIHYEPAVSVTSKKSGNSVMLTVSDNGNGIPQNIVDKIFQPFFTTKPTGQGTGLGLSLSYDVVKAHGGELKVESKEGKGSAFIIQLPLV